MKILGNFQYHLYKVSFECDDNEKEYTIKMEWSSLHNVNNSNFNPEVTIHNFDNIGKARDVFEELVEKIISNTSRSDVSLYMQQC